MGWGEPKPNQFWYRLKNALYGHPLSGDLWAAVAGEHLEEFGFELLDRDISTAFWVYREKQFDPRSKIIAVYVLYVDDGAVAASEEFAMRFKKFLDERYDIHDREPSTDSTSTLQRTRSLPFFAPGIRLGNIHKLCPFG